MNCLKNTFLRQLPKLVCDSSHLNPFQVNCFRRLTDSSNQRIITLNTNQLNSVSKQTNCDKNKNKTKANIKVTFIRNDGKALIGLGKEGDSLLDVVVDNDIDLDGFGACEATLACSTCHLIFTKEDFDKIADKATDEELDMLDLAYGLCDTSRLGCQVILNKDFDGLVVKVPAGVNDVRST